MSATYVLLQFGADPFNVRFEDIEGRPAFTVYVLLITPSYFQIPKFKIRILGERYVVTQYWAFDSVKLI
jgi:hypothetical protein